jgi:hypothetical protein
MSRSRVPAITPKYVTKRQRWERARASLLAWAVSGVVIALSPVIGFIGAEVLAWTADTIGLESVTKALSLVRIEWAISVMGSEVYGPLEFNLTAIVITLGVILFRFRRLFRE